MLQSIREKTSGWIASIILGLVILAMAFFGVESYLSPKVETYVAKIEGPAKFLRFGGQEHEIRPGEFRKRFESTREQQRQQQGKAFDATAFESITNKRQVLDQMIDEALLLMVAERDGIVISRNALQKNILGFEGFKVNGRFDPAAYQMALKSQGMTPREFEQVVGTGLQQQMVPNQLAASGLSGDLDLDGYYRLALQKRDARFLDIPPPAPSLAPPTDAELKSWYDAHAAKYRSPERVAVEYVEMNAATMKVDSIADEKTLRERYETEKARFGALEQRMGSHILVKVDQKAPPAQVEAARRKAQDLFDQARQPNADFAALAKAHSDDAGSRDAGGDLGPISNGVFGEAFDKAFGALQLGQVSEPVRLPDGWHVLLFRERLAGTTKAFEEVRPQLEGEFLERERERVYGDISGKLVDKVYADPGSLAPAAKELNLPVQRTAFFTAIAGEGIAGNPLVRKAAFSDTQKIERQTSDPIELEPNHMVMIRVTDVQPAAALPLASINTRVASDLLADRDAKAAKAQADALLARARKGESLDALATELGRTAAEAPGLGRQPTNPQLAPLFTTAFLLARPAAGKPEFGLATLAPGHYALVAVTAVKDGDTKAMDAATRTSQKLEFAKVRGAADARAYVDGLRKQFKVTVAEDRL